MRAALIASVMLAAAMPQAWADDAAKSGEADFLARCAPCHGINAKGDGPASASLKRKPADLTEITKKYGSFPEQRIFETIAGLDMPDAHGTREMPVWGDVFVSEAVGKSVKLEDALKASDVATKRIIALLRYLETIQASP